MHLLDTLLKLKSLQAADFKQIRAQAVGIGTFVENSGSPMIALFFSLRERAAGKKMIFMHSKHKCLCSVNRQEVVFQHFNSHYKGVGASVYTLYFVLLK